MCLHLAQKLGCLAALLALFSCTEGKREHKQRAFLPQQGPATLQLMGAPLDFKTQSPAAQSVVALVGLSFRLCEEDKGTNYSVLPCSGILVDERHVLTTAQCYQPGLHYYAVFLPDHIEDFLESACGQPYFWDVVHSIKNITPHPDFRFEQSAGFFHDIAVAELSAPLPHAFGFTRQPMALATPATTTFPLEASWGGFGSTAADSWNGIGTLRFGAIHLTANLDKRTKGYFVWQGQSESSPCVGDRGAPLWQEKTPGAPQLIGLVSPVAEDRCSWATGDIVDVRPYQAWIFEEQPVCIPADVETADFVEGRGFVTRQTSGILCRRTTTPKSCQVSFVPSELSKYFGPEKLMAAESFARRTVSLCEKYLPKLATALEIPVPVPLLLEIKASLPPATPSWSAPLTEAGTVVQFNLQHVWNSPEDAGMPLREIAKAVQNYTRQEPSYRYFWEEAVADYLSLRKFKFATGGRALHCTSFGQDSYKKGYGCAAAFLSFLEENKSKNVIIPLTNTMRTSSDPSAVGELFKAGAEDVDTLFKECSSPGGFCAADSEALPTD